MTCERGLEVQAYVDGELDAAASLAMERHLEICAECRALRDDLLDVRTAMHERARYHRPSAAFVDRIVDSLPRQAEERAGRPGSRSFWRGAIAGALTSALAASLALFVALPSAQDRAASDVVAAHLRSLMGDHLIDVASSNHHVVKPWFAGRADISPPVADYAKEGFALVGGRIDYAGGKRAAVVVYRHGAHVVNLFVWRDDGSARPASTTIDGYRLLTWTADGLAYCEVSDMAPEEMRALADLIRKKSAG